MKNLIKILILITLFFWTITSYNISHWSKVSVKITEYVPWLCSNLSEGTECSVQKPCKCEVEKKWWSLKWMLSETVKYITFIASLWAVLFIVINWIMYSMSWMDSWMKDAAKKRISKTLIWLILLLMSWVLLNMIAPWIYK